MTQLLALSDLLLTQYTYNHVVLAHTSARNICSRAFWPLQVGSMRTVLLNQL